MCEYEAERAGRHSLAFWQRAALENMQLRRLNDEYLRAWQTERERLLNRLAVVEAERDFARRRFDVLIGREREITRQVEATPLREAPVVPQETP